MRKQLFPVLLGIAALAAGCLQDSPTAPTAQDALVQLSRAGGREQVPFRARLEGTTVGVFGHPDCPPAHFGSTFTGAGQATHLGRTQATGFICLDAGTFAGQGQMILTGADGSQLVGRVSLQLVPREWPLFDVVGEYTITGGTGRFAGASGSGELRGELNWETDEAYFELEGTVSSVGSLRRQSR